MMEEFTLLETIFIWAVPVLFGIIVHEVSHGWVANYLGDPTARVAGRLSLNPVRHIDPIGTVILPAILLTFSNFVFGWAKPVPVTWSNLNHPRRDMAIVAFAGPFANVIMLLFWLVLAKLIITINGGIPVTDSLMLNMCRAGILINIILFVLNMLPVLPLDGGRVVSAILPPGMARSYAKLEPYGLIILLLLLVSGILWNLIGPVIFILDHLFQLLI